MNISLIDGNEKNSTLTSVGTLYIFLFNISYLIIYLNLHTYLSGLHKLPFLYL